MLKRSFTMLIIAVPFLAFGGFKFLHTSRFALHAQVAHGVVVSASHRGDGQYRTFEGYPNVVTFTDSYGKEHTTTIYYGQPGHYQPGTPIKLLYKQHDPAGTARDGNPRQLWGLSSGFLLAGALWLCGMFWLRAHGD